MNILISALLAIMGILIGCAGCAMIIICRKIDNVHLRLCIDVLIAIAVCAIAFVFPNHFWIVLCSVIASLFTSAFVMSLCMVN